MTSELRPNDTARPLQGRVPFDAWDDRTSVGGPLDGRGTQSPSRPTGLAARIAARAAAAPATPFPQAGPLTRPAVTPPAVVPAPAPAPSPAPSVAPSPVPMISPARAASAAPTASPAPARLPLQAPARRPVLDATSAARTAATRLPHPISVTTLPVQAAAPRPRTATATPLTGSAAVTAILRSAPTAAATPQTLRVLPSRLTNATPVTGPGHDHVGEPRPSLALRSLAPRSMAAERLVTSGRRARTLDVLAALSTGLDLADGHPEGHAQRTAYLALRLAASFGLSSEDRSTLLYGALLKDAGESAEAAFRAPDAARRDPLRSRVAQTQPVLARRAARGVEVARQLGLPETVGIAIHALRERWDGRGGPEGLAHEGIPVVSRILAIAEGAEIGLRNRDVQGAERLLKSRRGSWYDPTLVDLMLSLGKLGLWRELPADGGLPNLRPLEPVHMIRMSDDRGLDVVAATFADLVDARTPRQGRHAARVGILAARIGTRLGLPEDVVLDLRRAGLLHDIGKLGVPAGVFEKPAELNAAEQEAVAAHPAISAAILERCGSLAPLADLIRHHHELMDKPDRFPSLETPLRSIAARILALADRYVGMTADRPYRPALTAAQAIEILQATTADRLASQALRALTSIV